MDSAICVAVRFMHPVAQYANAVKKERLSMKNFDRGVGYYTKASAEINFPENDICCLHCPLMGAEYKPEREVCRLTGEYLPAYRVTIGHNCPLHFSEVK